MSERPDQIIERTELSGVYATHIEAQSIVPDLPPDVVVGLNIGEPAVQVESERILVKFAHRLGYYSEQPENETAEPDAGSIVVEHVAVFSFTGDDPTEEQRQQLIENAAFIVHPYARATLTRMGTEVGLPPISLPFLRRDFRLTQDGSDEAPADS